MILLIAADFLEDGSHVCKNLTGSEYFAGSIYKKDIDAGAKEVFLETIAFAEAAFEEIALDGALEVAFGDGDDDAGGLIVLSHKISVSDASATALLPMGEELRYPGKAGEPFTLWKGCSHY